MAITFRLEDVLWEKRTTQAELARTTGLAYQTVNAIHTNRAKRVTLETLDAICTALGVQPGELMAWKPGPQNPPPDA
ncbi:MAG: XRE family transcriptional regulator [Planctomycetaceae bacterium]|nr:MAG: XRE family transcriptional regulator [Planctomycetaceae bacterium]